MRNRPFWYDYLMIALAALLMAVSYALFVFPNAFAPAGVNGIITMVQYLFHISIGYLSLAINLPLIILAWKKVGHAFAVRSLIFVVVFSTATLLFRNMDLSGISYHTSNGTSLILGPVAAGAVSGFVSAWCSTAAAQPAAWISSPRGCAASIPRPALFGSSSV